MKVMVSVSAWTPPSPPAMFVRSVAQGARLGGVTVAKRGDKYTATGGDVSIVYDAALGSVTIKKDGKVLTQVKAPKVSTRLSDKNSTLAALIGQSVAQQLKSGVDPAPTKKIKFAAKAPERLTKEQAAEVRAKYGSTFAKKVIALGTALLSIKEVKRDADTSLMFWPFAFGPVTRKVKTAYGTMLRSDIYSMMAATPTVPFKPVGAAAQFRGYARCRVCGEQLGSATQFDASGVARPSNIAAHYNSHGIKCNLVQKVTTDKTTGKKYAVLYVGSLNSL